MDQHYDYRAAALQLESLTQERVSRKPDSQISSISNDMVDAFTVTKMTMPTRWRLTLPTTVDAKEIEEVIFRIQGIICAKELPPVHKDRKRQTHEAKFLRQGVQLTGLGAPSFHQSTQTITTLFSLFSRDFPDGMIHPWTPDQFSRYPALNLYNRYFYPIRDCNVQDSVALGEDIDPDRYLAGLALEAGVIHTEDNQVVYMERDKRKADKFIKTNPLSFKIGDIVEAVFSAVVAPVKDKKVQMLLVLRGLSLLDRQHSFAAHSHRVGQTPSSSSPTSSLTIKRKPCYDEDEEQQDNYRYGAFF